jgi:RNA polymerase sigma factor (sigma-70 family)
MEKNITDNELINKCLFDGDKSAWEAFVTKYSKLIWNSIRRTFHSYSFRYSSEDVEDVFSSVFLSLVEKDFNKLRQFRGENACSVSTWLSVAVVHMTIDYMRKDKGHLVVNSNQEEREIWELVPDTTYRSDRLLEKKQVNQDLIKAVKILTQRDRLIYDLLYNKGFSPEETAETLKLSVSIVYSRKHRIIEKIRKNITAM